MPASFGIEDWSLGILKFGHSFCLGLFAKEPIAPVLVIKDHRAKVPCIDVHLHCNVFRTYIEAIGKSLAPYTVMEWNNSNPSSQINLQYNIPFFGRFI